MISEDSAKTPPLVLSLGLICEGGLREIRPSFPLPPSLELSQRLEEQGGGLLKTFPENNRKLQQSQEQKVVASVRGEAVSHTLT